MKGGSFLVQKSAFIQLTDMDLYKLFKRTGSYITRWESCIAPSLITNGKRALAEQQARALAENQIQNPAQASPYAA